MNFQDYTPSLFRDTEDEQPNLTEEQEKNVDRIGEFLSSYIAGGVVAPLILSVLALSLVVIGGSTTALKLSGLLMIGSPIAFALLGASYIREKSLDADVIQELSSSITLLRLSTVLVILILSAQRELVTRIQSEPTLSLSADEVSQILFILSVGFVSIPSITMALSRYVETQSIKSAVTVGVFSIVITGLISIPLFG